MTILRYANEREPTAKASNMRLPGREMKFMTVEESEGRNTVTRKNGEMRRKARHALKIADQKIAPT